MKQVMARILSIFKVVDELCVKHNLRYYAIGGTCVGAVRHHGFIPWDDDMDIAMPVCDFLKLIEICKTELPDYMEILVPNTICHNSLFHLKVVDTRTTMIEDLCMEHKDIYEGVWLDIMPLSGVPSDEKERKKFVRKVELYRRINDRTKIYYPKERSTLGKISWVLAIPFRVLPHDFFWNAWMKLLKKYPFDDCEYTGYTWSVNLHRLIFPKSWFADYVELPFEDTTIRCPVGYDKYLTQQFGDYMQLPPKEKQFAHHDFAVFDLEHSYKDYQSGKLNAKEASKTMSKKGIAKE